MEMKYELAKELKEAGFVQPEAHLSYRGLFFNPENEVDSRWADGAVYVPTLSELIDAIHNLGHYGFALFQDDARGWHCGVYWDGSSLNSETGIGATPSEAVARLWLSLHSNK